MHGLSIDGEMPPEYSTFLSGKTVQLLDREGRGKEEFTLDGKGPIERSYEVILEKAYSLNETRDKRIIDETVHPARDITDRMKK
ncbi:MAG: hypothetical protein AABX35_03975 [Nanoarchaeota archaeon]